jgi:hypothetical protein
MIKFQMIRRKDESGVSGTGVVLEGAIFSSGSVVVCWLTQHSSIGIYRSYQEFLKVHVISHPTNRTRIEFDDGKVEEY